MKVCHVFNMANNGYHIVKALRERGVDADLIIRSTDFGMALPVWEEKEIEEDPYKMPFYTLLEKYGVPEYIKVWHEPLFSTTRVNKKIPTPNWMHTLKRIIFNYQFTVPDLVNLVKKYDLLHLHPPSPLLLHFMNKPKIIHESGWIRKIIHANTTTEKIGRRSYKRAKAVVWTNPDTYPLLEHLNIKRLEFIPFVVDPEQYRPLEIEKTEELLFFHPARQVWDVKGNDRLLKAFSKFIHAGYKAKLRIIDWGFEEDVLLAKILVTKEGLDDYVEWHQPYSKPSLVKVYNECDAVFDQYLLGSGGTTCYEAMSCETPVVIHLNEWNTKCFGEMPPTMEASTVDEIYNAMVDLTDAKLRRKIGQSARNFTMRHNHPNIIADKLVALYKEVLN